MDELCTYEHGCEGVIAKLFRVGTIILFMLGRPGCDSVLELVASQEAAWL